MAEADTKERAPRAPLFGSGVIRDIARRLYRALHGDEPAADFPAYDTAAAATIDEAVRVVTRHRMERLAAKVPGVLQAARAAARDFAAHHPSRVREQAQKMLRRYDSRACPQCRCSFCAEAWSALRSAVEEEETPS